MIEYLRNNDKDKDSNMFGIKVDRKSLVQKQL